jgi:hypothetical protein
MSMSETNDNASDYCVYNFPVSSVYAKLEERRLLVWSGTDNGFEDLVPKRPFVKRHKRPEQTFASLRSG